LVESDVPPNFCTTIFIFNFINYTNDKFIFTYKNDIKV
ncbi:unnamed protein product, partial [marine sediment metagenome]